MSNVYILLIFLIYLIIKKTYEKYFTEEYSNLSNNIFINEYARYKDYNILTLNNIQRDRPTLLTDYKFSEEYKLGFELSKINEINFESSEGMFKNIEKILKQGSQYQLCLCTENDIFNYFEKNGYDDNLRVVCSFYRKEMIFLVDEKFKIYTIQDIKNTINSKSRNIDVLRLGILDEKHGSYWDGIKILNSMQINDKTPGVKIIKFSSMRELIYNFDNNNLDLFYLTTTSKNKYIIELLRKNFVNIVGIGGIPEGLLRAKFDNIFKNNLDTNKYNRIVRDNNNLFTYNTSSNVGKKFIIKTYSTRLFLVCRKELPETFIYNLINNIYKNRIKLKENMDKYFLTKKNNTFDKLLQPFEMFYINEKMKYHEGAYNKYKQLGFITENLTTSVINKNVKSKLLLDTDPYQRLFTRK